MSKLNIKNVIGEKTKQALNNSYITSEQIKQNITVLDELRNFIPSPTPDELTLLEDNIIKNGCKDALLLWETTQRKLDDNAQNPDAPVYILVDGHNRYQICSKLNISFNVQVMSFASIKEVKDYMIDLQLGRRNLTPQQASYFRGLRYNLEKNQKGKYDRLEHKAQNEPYEEIALENHKAQNEPYSQVSKKEILTSEKLAKEYNVSKNTIKRDAEFSLGLEQLNATLKRAVLSGEIKISKNDIQKLSKRLNKTTIENELELEDILKEDLKVETLVNVVPKSITTTRKKLADAMIKILNTKSTSIKELDRLIEIANELKQLL